MVVGSTKRERNDEDIVKDILDRSLLTDLTAIAFRGLEKYLNGRIDMIFHPGEMRVSTF